jgi:hypothetical protein
VFMPIHNISQIVNLKDNIKLGLSSACEQSSNHLWKLLFRDENLKKIIFYSYETITRTLFCFWIGEELVKKVICTSYIKHYPTWISAWLKKLSHASYRFRNHMVRQGQSVHPSIHKFKKEIKPVGKLFSISKVA